MRETVEAIVRGYITGSAWQEYTEKGTVHGIRVSGLNGTKLVEGQAFEEPLYTPCTYIRLSLSKKKGIFYLLQQWHTHESELICFIHLSATKAEAGAKDENIHPDQGIQLSP